MKKTFPKIPKTCIRCYGDFLGVAQAKYCAECKKKISHEYHMAHKIVKPATERICRKCGKPFMGRFRQAYCWDCLHDGSDRMRKYLRNRRDSDWEYMDEWTDCKHCGKHFYRGTVRFEYCSLECRKAAEKIRQRKKAMMQWEKGSQDS